ALESVAGLNPRRILHATQCLGLLSETSPVGKKSGSELFRCPRRSRASFTYRHDPPEALRSTETRDGPARRSEGATGPLRHPLRSERQSARDTDQARVEVLDYAMPGRSGSYHRTNRSSRHPDRILPPR